MNSSLWSASRSTHVKIVAVSLMASIILIVIGFNARVDSGATARIETNPVVVKAGKPSTYTDNAGSTIR
jgi:hypothetical protein